VGKRKRGKRRTISSRREPRAGHRAAEELGKVLERAGHLIDRGRPQEAVELLEPLVSRHPDVADLHYTLGYARSKAGDPWQALASYERAQESGDETDYFLPLAFLYLQVGLHVHALRAFRQVLRQGKDRSPEAEVRTAVAELEKEVTAAAQELGRPVNRMEEGLYHMEQGQRALSRGDFPAGIDANRRAIRLLKDWPPPHNNLSQALFYSGRPQEAIATARRVLARDPDNVQALVNGVRFLAWTGNAAAARELWAHLEKMSPIDASDRIKMAEAAAVLGHDESVHRLLHPLDTQNLAAEGLLHQEGLVQFFLAVAEANLGRRKARRRLKALEGKDRQAGRLLAALKDRRAGPGWAERFPYFDSSELVPAQEIVAFLERLIHQEELPSRRFRRQVARFVERFPQIVLVAEKLIWEEDQAETGLSLLETLDTPAARAALRRFGLSQAGDDDLRLKALSILAEAGEIKEDEPLRVWTKGEWRELQLRRYDISDEAEVAYPPEVADLLNEGLAASQGGDHEQAERLFRRAIELEPLAKEGHNNLGAIYARRGEREKAKEAFRAAAEIDPHYVFPRCNLVATLLEEGDIEGAEAWLQPLTEAKHFRPLELALYFSTRARLLMHHEEYETARRALQTALEVQPDYEPAKSLLEHLGLLTRLREGWGDSFTRWQERDRAKRTRLQARLTTPDPTLSKALSLYTKDALTGMARVVLPWGGWSTLRKAELVQAIVTGLQDPESLEHVVADLSDEERDALRQVLESGGSMAWEAFDARYGNDLEESAYWNYHVPETTMGRLRLHGVLVEATVEGQLRVAIPAELRPTLENILA
jgi:tetratricopeptide (TPR) repeat protein